MEKLSKPCPAGSRAGYITVIDRRIDLYIASFLINNYALCFTYFVLRNEVYSVS